MYSVGSRVLTRDGTMFGNGIIVGAAMLHDNTRESYQIESDFGNIYFLSRQAVDEHFSVPSEYDEEPDLTRWLEAREKLRGGGCYSDLIYRLEKRAEIRRSITTRKSVQEGQPDRIADLLEEAAQALRSRSSMAEQGVVNSQAAGSVPVVTAKRMYPDAGLKEPVGEFRNSFAEIVRKNFKR